MRTPLHNLAISQHQDEVRFAHRAQAVCNHKGRPPLHHGNHRTMDEAFGFHIDTGRGVVEHQNGGIEQDRPGDGETLLLSARQGDATLADVGVIAVGETHDLIVQLGDLSRLDHIVNIGMGNPVSNVVADRGIEEEHVLLYHAHVAPQGVQGKVPDVVTVDDNPPLGDIIEAGQQIDDRALATARCAQKGNHLSGCHFHRHVFERGGLWVIREGNIVKTYPTLHPTHGFGSGFFFDR